MPEYIEREALLEFLVNSHDDKDWLVSQYNADWIYSWIESRLAADVAPVVHGRWEKYTPTFGVGDFIKCSVCNKGRVNNLPERTNYCPNCGARMDGEG